MGAANRRFAERSPLGGDAQGEVPMRQFFLAAAFAAATAGLTACMTSKEEACAAHASFGGGATAPHVAAYIGFKMIGEECTPPDQQATLPTKK